MPPKFLHIDNVHYYIYPVKYLLREKVGEEKMELIILFLEFILPQS